MINFNTNKIVLLRFPQYSGGNFICNCLGLSRHTVLKHIGHARYLYDNPGDYNYRLNAVMSTLPDSSKGKSELRFWQTMYEWNDAHLYSGVDLTNWSQRGLASCHDDFIAKLSNSDFDFFLLQHSYYVTKNVLKVWPNARIIQLINFEKLWHIAAPLKARVGDPTNVKISHAAGNEYQEKYNELAGPSWPSWGEFQQVGYNIDKISGVPSDVSDEIKQFYNWHEVSAPMILFDIDNSIFEKSTFLAAMQELYLKLGYDDFDETRISTFWQAYMELHVDNPA